MAKIAEKPRIAVIGAGIAGLSCATALKRAGIDVAVFDKSRGASGRMSTRRADGWQCDHGAQYFTARDPRFRAEVARWEQAGVAAPWSFRLKVFDESNSRDADAGLERFVGVPRMSAPGRWLADALELTTETTITQLRRDRKGWALVSGERGPLDRRFDAVVVAVPAPQAVPLLREPSPLLGAKAGGATMRGCWALMLRFATPVDLPFDAAFVNHGPLRWIARDSAKPGRTGPETWLLHANAPWSEAHLEDSPEAVANTLLRAFTELGGPAPQAWSAHRWRYADTEPPIVEVCAWDAKERLGMCGDWLNGGKVEGAWLSGSALARRVLDTIGA